MPAQRARIPVEERLFSLVLALLATENGLTKSQILSSVYGYAERFAADGASSALERQFERDKDDIRELGIPLETIDAPDQPGNTQVQRYRIPKGSYDLPRDVRFTPRELGLLSLASRVWREGSLSAESRRALLKLRSLGVESDEQLIGYAPRLRARDAAFNPLSFALERHVVVEFPYLRPGDEVARTRQVEPLALFLFRSRWYLNGFDRGVGSERTFLLSRIVGEIVLTRESFEQPEPGHAVRALDELQELWQAGVAIAEVEPGSDAAARLGKSYGTGELGETRLVVHYSDLALLADELAGYGPEVLVVEPAELRDAVVERLRRTAAAHRPETPAGDVDEADGGAS